METGLRRFGIFTLVVAAVFVAGCDTSNPVSPDNSSNDGGDGGGGGSGTADEFFPLELGYTWNYDTTYDYDGGDSKLSKTSTISRTEDVGGNTYSVLHNDYTQLDTALRIEDNIIRSTNSYSVVLKTAAPGQETESDWPMFDFNKSAGQSWTVYSDNISGNETDVTGTALAAESVTTPAGTYSDCVKFMHEIANTTVDGGETTTYTNRKTFWMARNVGIVKVVEEGYNNGEKLYANTTELTGFTPPSQ